MNVQLIKNDAGEICEVEAIYEPAMDDYSDDFAWNWDYDAHDYCGNCGADINDCPDEECAVEDSTDYMADSYAEGALFGDC